MQLKTTSALFLFLCNALFWVGCSSKESASINELAAQTDSVEESAKAKNETPVPKLVIRQAEVKFKVTDLEKSARRAEDLILQTGATLAQSNQQETAAAKSLEMEIKVKPGNFLPLLRQLQAESIQLDTKTISTQDVALEYVDLEARANAKLAVEQRIKGLLTGAKNIQQILEVEHQLQTIREEIESTQARLRFLQTQTALSTIRLAMYQEVPPVPSSEPGFFSRLREALDSGWQLTLSLVIGLFYLWPLWLVGLGVLLYLRKRNLA